MFGLGPAELLLLAAVIALVGGPAAIKKVFRMLASLQRARSKLSSKALVDELLRDKGDGAEERRKRPK